MIRLDIPGRPVPQGSMRAYPSGGMAHSNERDIKGFRSDVATAWGERPMVEGPLYVDCTFTFARPEKHWLPANRKRPERVLRADAAGFHMQSPDVDKLLRAVLDALTHRAYEDDSQVVMVRGHKTWGVSSSTRIDVVPIR